MRTLTVLIPSRNRIEKLNKTLKSIPSDLGYVNVVVACDGDMDTFNSVVDRGYTAILIKEHRGSVFCRNLAINKCVADGLLYATDDVEFCDRSIQSAFSTFNKEFPDDDGVVGFIQNTKTFHKTGVGLVGKNFLNRFPEKKLFFPGYFHFGCQEILRLCERSSKKLFVQDKKAKIIHHHPSFYHKYVDDTHKEARRFKKYDLQLSSQRERLGLIWGKV